MSINKKSVNTTYCISVEWLSELFGGFVSAFCPFQVFLILPGTYVLSIFASCWIKCHCVKMLQIVRYLASWRIFNNRNAINEQTWRNMWRHRSFCASGCPAILLMKPAKINDYDDGDNWWEELITMIMMKRWLWWWSNLRDRRAVPQWSPLQIYLG